MKPKILAIPYRFAKIGIILIILILGYNQTIEADDNQNQKIVTISAIDNVYTHTLAIETLREAYKRIGYKAIFDFLPAKRALVWANEGKTDGDAARILNTDKVFPNLIQVPTSVVSLVGVAFTKTVKRTINNWNDLKGLNVGIIQGMRFAVIGTKGMNPLLAEDTNHLFALLAAGRIDIAITGDIDGKIEIAKKYKTSGIHIVGVPLHVAPLFHFVHVKNKDLVPKLDSVLNSMKQDGTIEAIHQRTLANLIK